MQGVLEFQTTDGNISALCPATIFQLEFTTGKGRHAQVMGGMDSGTGLIGSGWRRT